VAQAALTKRQLRAIEWQGIGVVVWGRICRLRVSVSSIERRSSERKRGRRIGEVRV
jgi:hypothetical protein